ncbi:OmcA/MtrC family decaheme c-type cytochrome [Thiogranum longum]
MRSSLPCQLSAESRQSTRSLYRFIGIVVLALGIAACGGDDGDDGDPGPPGPPGAGAGGVNAATVPSDQFAAEITGVSVASPPVVTFTLETSSDSAFPGININGLQLSNVRFYMAKLVPSVNGEPSRWVDYTTRDNSGTFEANEDGSYTYTFAEDVTALPEYDSGAVTRVSFEIRNLQAADGNAVVPNPWYDFRPNGDSVQAPQDTRDIANVGVTCNGCHGQLSFHGGARLEVEACVICHNPDLGSPADPQQNDVDFKRLIHKLHVNAEAGLPTMPVLIDGEEIHHPQDTRNCFNCHNEDNPDVTPNGANWYTSPSIEACGACHDDVSFASPPVNHPVSADNSQCSSCHAGQFPEIEVRNAHLIPSQEAAANFQYNILGVSFAGPAPAAPTVRFSITDPTNLGGANDPDGLGERYDLSDLSQIPALEAANTRMTVAWDTINYNNGGSGTNEAQPERTDVITGGALNVNAIDNGDRSYSLPLTDVSTAATGSGTVTMEGHPVDPVEGNLAVKSAVEFFAITDAQPVARRAVVDVVNNCDVCHGQLALHGANRVDNEQDCVTCHNPDATDRNRRPDPDNLAVPGPDGKAEQAIDFKYMIHAIHAANITVYGFGNSVNDFSEVKFPEPQLSNCIACHRTDTYYPFNGTISPVDGTAIAGTTINSGADRTTATDNIRMSPTTGVCSACHVSDAERDDPNSLNTAKLHMIQNGGNYALPDGAPVQETCYVCHGPNSIADVGVVHGVK